MDERVVRGETAFKVAIPLAVIGILAALAILRYGSSGDDALVGTDSSASQETSEVTTQPTSSVPAASDARTTDSSTGADDGTVAPIVGCPGDGAPTADLSAHRVAFFAICPTDDLFRPVPVFRPPTEVGSSPEERLKQRVEALVGGTTDAESAAGLAVGFDGIDEADRIEVETTVDRAGIAMVEFLIDDETWNPGGAASASAQLGSFLDPLLATVFLDTEIAGIDLSNLCWGEMGCGSGITTRADWQGIVLVNSGTVTSGGCDAVQATLRPGECTVDGLLEGPILPMRVVDVADDDTLNLRAGPGVEYFMLDEVPPDELVDGLDAVALADDRGTWRLVAGPGAVGWANTAFLSLQLTSEDALLEQFRTSREGEGAVADLFVVFANEPTPTNFDRLPLAPEVELGLGPELRRRVEAGELADPRQWSLDDDAFRGRVGPFSAFETLSGYALDEGLYEVTTGPHPHCAAAPVPPPAPFEDAGRISVQPRQDTITSCLEWSTVDLFLDADGRVAAITFDTWEP